MRSRPFVLCRESEAHGSARIAFQRPMHCAGVTNEVCSGPRVAAEKLVRQHVALEPITRGAGGDEVARGMRASLRHGVHVIERRDVERERNRAVDAAATAVTHGSVLECPLEAVFVEVPRAAGEAARCAGERDSVETTSRHCTSL